MGSAPKQQVQMPTAPELTTEGRAKADAAAREEMQRKRGKAAQLVYGGNTAGIAMSPSIMSSGGAPSVSAPKLTGF